MSWSCGSTIGTCAPVTGGAFPRAMRSESGRARSGPPVTSRSRPCDWRASWDLPPEGYQGNWIPHQLRPAVEDGVFFAGDSAGHCLPLTAEGIRTALYFGLACARELRSVREGRITREQALARYGAFSDRHERKYRWLLNTQRLLGRLTPTYFPTAMSRSLQSQRFADWIFEHYLEIAPPSFVDEGPPASPTTHRRSPSAGGIAVTAGI